MEDRRDSGDPEAIYDQYLDASLTGEPEDPAAFFARYPGIDTHGRAQIEALHGVLTGTEQSPDAEAQVPFERIGGYRLLRAIGHGGMGTIYLAEQESLSRLVALKLLRPELSASKSALRRFQREAKVIARLSHPNVVRVHELGEDHGVQFIAMELVPGRTLQDIFPRGRPSIERTLAWMEQCARALQAAHDEGIVHRDVKPANILITPDDRPVLLDFGMAHLSNAEGTRLTQTFAGSPSYAAPEQVDARGELVDGRTDVYGLGATLYECLTLQLPFTGKSLEEIFQKILRYEPEPPRKFRPGLPRDIETVTLKAMAKLPKNRYQTAREFADDLQALRERRRIQARPPGLVARARRWARRRPARASAIAASLLAAALLVGALAWQTHSNREARREKAQAHLAQAREHVAAYRDHRIRHASALFRLVHLSERVEDSFLTQAQVDELDDVSVTVEKLQQERRVLFHETLGLLRDAERLDSAIEGAERVRAQLYVEMTEEAIEERNFIEAKFFSGLVRAHDPSGELTQASRESGVLKLTVDPPDAALYLFRERELYELGQTNQRRYVSIPVGTTVPPTWLQRGEWALRVVRDKGDLRTGDIITEVNGHPIRDSVLLARDFRDVPRGARIDGFDCMAAVEELAPDEERAFQFGDREIRCKPSELPAASIWTVAASGGLPATVVRNRVVLDVTLPAGIELRTTANPLLTGEDNLLQLPASRELELEPGDYRILARAPGHEEVVLCIHSAPRGRRKMSVRLPREGAGPAGFVYIPFREPFWIMEREVTCDEYLEFLNATGHPTQWPHDTSGTVIFPDDHRPEWPAIGLSFHDAQAYARWRGEGFALPTRHQWAIAAQGPMARSFVFGNVWRAHWAKSCFSRPRALPEPVLRYPVDESVYRVYDLTGSAAEWIDDWFDEGRGMRRLGGSSWGFADPELFKIWGGNGEKPEARSHTFGFRLAWSPSE